MFNERKRRSQIRKRFYRAKTSLAKSKMHLPTENVSTEGKRLYRVKKYLLKTKMRSPSKNVYLANTSLPKLKTRLPSESVPRKGDNFFPKQNLRQKSLSRAKTHINERIRVYIAKTGRRKRAYRADTFLTKGENAYLAKTCLGKAETLFSERKRRKQRRKSVYRGKKRLPSENAFPERKRNSERRKSLYGAKKSLANAITLYRAKTSLAKWKTFLPSLNFDRKRK